MNSPDDDKSFDEYLQRGSAVSKQYRAMQGDEVPAALDASILAQAASEVSPRREPKARAWSRWSVPVAVAASAVLALSIVLETGVRNEFSTVTAVQDARQDAGSTSPSLAPEAPIRTESSPVAEAFLAEEKISSLELDAAPAAAPSLSVESAPKQEAVSSADAFDKAQIEPQSPSPVAVELHAAATEAPRYEEAENASNAISQTAAKERPDRARTQVTSARREVVAPPAAPLESGAAEIRVTGVRDSSADASSGAEAESAAESSDPDKWLERIRELRQAGKNEDADREWRRFREAFPDYAVAADDRAQPR